MSTPDRQFPFDVFLSHSSKDKPVVRALAERMRRDGLTVWLDEWVLKPGDSIPAKIEEGLENSRVLVLCMSANAFGSDWSQLEAGTFRFRDPLNKERRFLPLRLDDAPLKGSLAQFLYLDWNPQKQPEAYPKLLEACRQTPQPAPSEETATDHLLHQILSLGHTDSVWSVAWSPDGKRALSGSEDKTVRLWDVETGRSLRVLEGHTSRVWSVAWSPDGKRALSAAENGVARVWELPAAVPPLTTESEQVQYTNAKVLLIGESGVGKTGLSNYFAHGLKVQDDQPLPSTDGAWATHWPLGHDGGADREIWLWDFAGQVDYRLVHQLFMSDAAVAVLVFNPQIENPFEGLAQWDHDLRKAAPRLCAKLLAAARIDRGSLVVSAARAKKFMQDYGFHGSLHETSAKTGEGCDELRKAIVGAIDWEGIPNTTSPALYHRMKREILHLRDQGLILIRLSELKQRIEMTLTQEHFELAELETVIGLLAGPGMIQRLDFGGFVLLQPEVLSRYASAAVRKIRKHPHELGCIREDELLAGDLDYQDFNRIPREDEAVVLRALVETFVSRAWCLRQVVDGAALLTFPSYFRRERKEQPAHPSVLVTYRFDGPADEIYATLVVRLHHTSAFESTDLWKSAADFQTQTGQKLGFTMQRESEGPSLLEVYFEPDVDENSRVLFLRYVQDHLTQHAQNVNRLRHYACANPKCKSFGKPFKDREAIEEALAPVAMARLFAPNAASPSSCAT